VAVFAFSNPRIASKKARRAAFGGIRVARNHAVHDIGRVLFAAAVMFDAAIFFTRIDASMHSEQAQ
jgi:hypothetical protein